MGYTVAWLLWGAMFFVIEIPAILDKRSGDTLSEHLRKWFSTKDKSWGWVARRGVLALFFVWFIIHLFVDGPGPL